MFLFYAAVTFSTKREKPLLKMFEAFAVGKSYSSSIDASYICAGADEYGVQ